MAETASFIEKYKVAENNEATSAADLHSKIVAYKPEWEKHEATKAHAANLKHVEIDAPALKNKAILAGNPAFTQSLLDGLAIRDEDMRQWILTFFFDFLREDSSCFALFDDMFNKGQLKLYKPLMALLESENLNSYIADKAAWLLTAVIGHVPFYFTTEDVNGVLKVLLQANGCSEIGILEAITNLLKSGEFRRSIWEYPGVSDKIFKVQPKADPPPYLYRCIFAVWLLSFDDEITSHLKNYAVVKKVKDILSYSRTEKVIRLCLTLLKNLLPHRELCEEIVEDGVLEAVQQLEFEKWRDAELYDEIRDMSSQIATEVQEMSNFDRYERELQTGVLSWGFIHSSKFWAENVLKFEQNDFRALKCLAGLLTDPNTEPTTLAVACHDLGEFVTMHPLGKRKVAQLNVKEKIMQLMGSTDQAHREVRREALLCCQKIMLNKWQEMDTAQ